MFYDPVNRFKEGVGRTEIIIPGDPNYFTVSAKMAKRVHVVGSSPRTGTTLITELLVNCFRVDGFAEYVMSVFKEPKLNFSDFCSKNPRDILSVRALLNLNPDLWIIHMERDPRDVIVSRHLKDADKYWTNLGRWKSRRKVVKKIGVHPRFLESL